MGSGGVSAVSIVERVDLYRRCLQLVFILLHLGELLILGTILRQRLAVISLRAMQTQEALNLSRESLFEEAHSIPINVHLVNLHDLAPVLPIVRATLEVHILVQSGQFMPLMSDGLSHREVFITETAAFKTGKNRFI